MDKSVAIEIIEKILESYKQNPAQNHFEINISSFVANNSGGTGFSASPSGGAPGSTTIGMQSSMDGAQINIAQSHANDAINDVNESIVSNLTAIIDDLSREKPDKSKISNIFGTLSRIVGTTAMTVAVKYVLKSQGIDV